MVKLNTACSVTNCPSRTVKLYETGVQCKYAAKVSWVYLSLILIVVSPCDKTSSPIANGIHVSVDPMEITKEMNNFEPTNLPHTLIKANAS